MIIDLIIIAIILVCIFFGYKRGLIGVAFKFLSLILAIILAFMLHGPVSNFIINNTSIDEKIENTISKNIDLSNYENKTPEEISQTEGNIPQVFLNQFKKSMQNTIDNTKENVEAALVKQLSNSIINITVLIILFIVIKLILLVINLIGDIISKLPVINKFDKLGGIIYGILEGFLIVYGILALCLIIAPFIQGNNLLEILNNSNLGSMLYNNNILLKIIG